MPIFELIGSALDVPALAHAMPEILNTNYSSILGDNINFVIGGGRINNMYGTDTKLVMDWEELITQGFFPSQMATLTHGVISSKTYGMLMGIGGDATLVFGNRTSFLYYGESLNVSRIPHPVINISSPSTKDPVLIKQLLEAGILEANTQTVPPQIQLCLAAGSLGLLAVSLLMRFYNGLNGIYSSSKVAASDSETQKIILAAGCMLISGLETRWLYLLKWLEANTSILVQQAVSNLVDLNKKVAESQKELDAATARNIQQEEQFAANLEAMVSNAPVEAAMVRNTQIIEEKTQAITDYLAKKEAVMATLASTYGLTGGGGATSAIQAPVTPVVSQKATYQSYELAVNDYTLNALTGDVNIKASAPAKTVNLNAQSVNLAANLPVPAAINTNAQASIAVSQGPEEGTVAVEAVGTAPAININANIIPNPLSLTANILVNNAGINITYGPPEAQGVISMTSGMIKIAIGPIETGNSILLSEAGIGFKVGANTMMLTKLGLSVVAPLMQVTCEETTQIINAGGITEEVGEVTRETTVEGHNFTAAEVEVNIGVNGITYEAPMSSSEFEGSAEFNTAMLTQGIDAMLSQESALSII
jgi:hypothetical protein